MPRGNLPHGIFVSNEPMPEHEPRLYLMLPPAFAPVTLVSNLSETLMTGEVAAVLLWLASDDEAAWGEAASALLPVLHEHGVPLLVGGDAGRASQLGTDGMHLETSADELRTAVKGYAPRLMVGAGGIASRHDAMLAGECGADYVLFGSVDPAREPPVPPGTIFELTEWWSEAFQVPCVAEARTLSEAEALGAVGADFIAAGDLVWSDPGGPAAAILALTKWLQRRAAAS